MSLPVRSTFVSIENSGILISPGSRNTPDQLNGLKTVTDLVAPNLFHGAGIKKANAAFPNAKIWGVTGSREQRSYLPWTDVLSADKWPYQNELPMVLLKGMPKVNEVVFFHKASKSLIVTDLCFNMKNASGIGAWIILNMFGTYNKLGVSRFFKKFTNDKMALEKSLDEVFAFDFDNIIVSHGENVISNAKEKLLHALSERNIQPR